MLSAKNYLTFPAAVKSIFEYLVYFFLLFFVFRSTAIFSGSSNADLYSISGMYLLIIFLYKYFYENALVVRYLMITDSFERILIKPVNPLFRILVEKIDTAGLALFVSIFIGILAASPSRYLLLMFSGLVVSFSVFVLVLSLLLLTSGKLPVEKLLLGLFLIGFLGFANTPGIFATAALSIVFLIVSIRLWNFALRKYTSTGS